MDDVIRSIDDITPERLTRILNCALNADLAIDKINIRLSKELPYSTVARLELDIGPNRSHAPRALFLKIIRNNVFDPALNAEHSEVEFYNRVAKNMPSPPIVHCYHAAASSETQTSHLLLQDLSDSHFQPDDDTAPSFSQSVRAVEALARCHAGWWNDSRLGRDIGKLFTQADLDRFVIGTRTNVARFLEIAGNDINLEQRVALQLMVDNAELIWGRLTNRDGLTLIHGDCHWWNFLFPNDPIANEVYLIDWHLWHVDLGARDLAFLLALGGFADPRPDLETELLRSYQLEIVRNGVTDYTCEELYTDYRWSSVRNLNIPVIFWTQGKHLSTWKIALERAFGSFERLGCANLFA